MTDIQTLTRAVLVNPYTRASFRTLDKHATRGTINTCAALRLLRRNVRDVAPQSSSGVQQAIARALLTYWHERRKVDTSDNDSHTE